MPEKNYDKNNNSEEMRCLKEFVAEVSKRYISHVFIRIAFSTFRPSLTESHYGMQRLAKPGKPEQQCQSSKIKAPSPPA